MLSNFSSLGMLLNSLDAFVAPTGSPAWKTDLTMVDNIKVLSSSPSTQAGYQIITLLMGYIYGLPVGVSFRSGEWSEPVQLEIAYQLSRRGVRD